MKMAGKRASAWTPARQRTQVLRHLGHIHRLLDRLRTNVERTEGVPEWVACDLSSAFDACVAAMRSAEAADGRPQLVPRPSREKVLRSAFAEGHPAPGIAIQWHLTTTRFDFCPRCGHPDIEALNRHLRACLSCGHRERLPVTVRTWKARFFHTEETRPHPRPRYRQRPGRWPSDSTVLCGQPGCDRLAIRANRCAGCYEQYRTRHTNQTRRGPYKKADASCKEPGCPTPPVARGWCNKHYLRWRRGQDCTKAGHGDYKACGHIDTDTGLPCLAAHYAKGFCQKHYRQLKKQGVFDDRDPSADDP